MFDAWTQETWDQNDTVAGTPWLVRMQASTAVEQRAARLALAHAGTPTVAKLDALGRTFLTIADNGSAGRYATRVALDVEGHPRTITDARGVVTAAHVPDLLGHMALVRSADAGETCELADVAGKPVFTWNARGRPAVIACVAASMRCNARRICSCKPRRAARSHAATPYPAGALGSSARCPRGGENARGHRPRRALDAL